jgi:hypothetical protein
MIGANGGDNDLHGIPKAHIRAYGLAASLTESLPRSTAK